MKPAVFALLMLACWTTTSALLPACGPEDAAARIGLGVATLSTGDHAGSLAHFRAAAALDESSSTAHYNLGLALARGGAPAEAIAPLKRAVELEPDDAEFLGALGEAHAADGAHGDAVAAFDRALSLLPDEPSLFYNRANSLADLGRTEAAVEGYRAAIARGGDDATRLHLGEKGDSTSLQCYADDFDADLVGKLAYRGPAALVDEIRGDARGWASVLDVGAGTGLLAKELSGSLAPGCRVHANDVSRKMLDRAPPGLYSSVAVGDAVDVLEAWPDGDLDAVLARRRRLYPRRRRSSPPRALTAAASSPSPSKCRTTTAPPAPSARSARRPLPPRRPRASTRRAAGFRREPAFADLREDAGARVRGAVLVFVRR
ncbi:hypothetical protein JL720_12389 [Aureococcus anophagefferens]|nr:hypothetical protein JL720_12389 [Aureococcus anophagefferens]